MGSLLGGLPGAEREGRAGGCGRVLVAPSSMPFFLLQINIGKKRKMNQFIKFHFQRGGGHRSVLFSNNLSLSPPPLVSKYAPSPTLHLFSMYLDKILHVSNFIKDYIGTYTMCASKKVRSPLM